MDGEAVPKISHISWTTCGWRVHSSEKTLLRDSMSAPWFSLPGTCIALSERRLCCAHSKRRYTRVKKRALLGDLSRPPRSYCPSGPESGAPSGLVKMHEGLDTLLAILGSWCGYFLPLRPQAGQPSHRPPQPVMEASVETVETTFCRPLSRVCPVHPLMTFPRAEGCHACPVHLDSQASCVRCNPRIQPALKGPHMMQAQL